ncbi:MAG: ABC transporter substrate-binding protein, partial [Haloarculaceae archaeon]
MDQKSNTTDRVDSQQSPTAVESADRTTRRSRRAVLAAGGAAAITSLTGCLGGGGDTTTEDGGSDGTPADGDGTPMEGDGTPMDGDDSDSGTTTGRDYPDEVVIGSIHPLSGSTAYTGKRTHQAIKLAAMVANENGGIESMDGAEVTVIESDHKNDPSLGAEGARELVDQGAHVLTGTYSSAVTSATATAAEGQGVPFVIDVSTAASILQERQFDYVYRTQPNSLEMARNTINHTVAAADLAGYALETVGLFYIDQTYGQSLRDGLRTAA